MTIIAQRGGHYISSAAARRAGETASESHVISHSLSAYSTLQIREPVWTNPNLARRGMGHRLRRPLNQEPHFPRQIRPLPALSEVGWTLDQIVGLNNQIHPGGSRALGTWALINTHPPFRRRVLVVQGAGGFCSLHAELGLS